MTMSGSSTPSQFWSASSSSSHHPQHPFSSISRGATPPPHGAYDGSSDGGGSGASSSLPPLVGVTRSRTLLFLSYRDSVPRTSARTAASFPSLTGSDDPLGALGGKGKGKARQTSLDRLRGGKGGAAGGKKRQKGGAYFDASGELHEDGEEEDERDTAALLRQSQPQRDSHAIDIPSLPPRWVDVSDEVDGILNELQPKITQLDRLHAKNLLPGFVDRTKEEREIEMLGGEITKEFRRCSKLIASLAASTQTLIRSGKASTHEISMAQNVQTALAQRVQSTSGQFRKKQSNYMQRLRGQDVRHREVLGELGLSRQSSSQGAAGGSAALRDEELAAKEDLEMSKAQLRSGGQQAQTQLLIEAENATDQDAEIQQRNNDIDHIATSIVELSQLFQDLQSLVITQGTLVDRIDYNIENMGHDIRAAVQELNTASATQKRTGKGQCMLFLILLCALCVAVIIIKPFWRLFAGSSTPAGEKGT